MGEAPSFDEVGARYLEELDEAVGTRGGAGVHYVRLKTAHLAALARRHLGADRGAGRSLRVLDAGCGIGLAGAALAEATSWRVTGVDLSLVALRAGHGRRVQGNLAALPVRRAAFDLAFSMNVFHHLPRSRFAAVCGALWEAIRPGGIVAIYEHNPSNPFTRRVVRRCRFDEGVVLVPPREMGGILAAAGAAAHLEYTTFVPAALSFLAPLDRHLARIPCGAQYCLWAQKAA